MRITAFGIILFLILGLLSTALTQTSASMTLVNVTNITIPPPTTKWSYHVSLNANSSNASDRLLEAPPSDIPSQGWFRGNQKYWYTVLSFSITRALSALFQLFRETQRSSFNSWDTLLKVPSLLSLFGYGFREPHVVTASGVLQSLLDIVSAWNDYRSFPTSPLHKIGKTLFIITPYALEASISATQVDTLFATLGLAFTQTVDIARHIHAMCHDDRPVLYT